jgi:hypothetical protein
LIIIFGIHKFYAEYYYRTENIKTFKPFGQACRLQKTDRAL